MRRMPFSALAMLIGFAGWTNAAVAGLFSATGPIIAIFAGDLYQGEAEGKLDGSGTFGIQSRTMPELSCRGQFAKTAELAGAGDMRCSDAATATFQFKRLSLMRGHGSGSSSRGPMSFTYGLSASESAPYLILPPGKKLVQGGKDLMLVDARQAVPSLIAAAFPLTRASSGPIPPLAEAAPEKLLSAATLRVASRLRQDMALAAITPGKIAELVESTILPLFDFRHMTELALARNWRLASPAQQNAIIAEFRALLAHTYSTALANYRDQEIEYKPPRRAPGDSIVTVKSIVKQPGRERMAIDYDMEKTPVGWKIYDIKIAGVSLITTYRSTFA
ncbi:MAG: ABC transporter substrate-binding protein, partial [Sulfuricaulis sp.]|nr:ABC transporter substrate-binding protein [Sulfuricaulis sp.]